MSAMQVLQQAKDLFAGTGVEVARRLIGKEDGRVPGEGSGQGDALHLAAGEFACAVMGTVLEADLSQQFEGTGARFGLGDAADEEGHGGVLDRGELWQEVMTLPNEPNRLIAENGQFGVRQVGDVGGTVIDCAVARGVERAEEVQQGGLASAGFTGKCQALTLLDGKLKAAKNSQLGFSRAVYFGEIFSANCDVRHWY